MRNGMLCYGKKLKKASAKAITEVPFLEFFPISLYIWKKTQSNSLPRLDSFRINTHA